MRKLLLILILGMMVLPMVMAEDIYKQGEVIDLKIPCYKANGNLCSSSAICNISINYPNESALISGKATTNRGAYHNYTLTKTDILGEYKRCVNCQDGADYGHKCETFIITPKGGIINQGNTSWAIVLIIAFLGIAALMFYLSTTFKSAPFKTLFIMFGFGSILLSIQFARILIENSALSLSDDLVKLIMPVFIFGIVSFILLIVYLFIVMMTKTIKYLKGK